MTTKDRSPFPGMDPYLESPEIWPAFHQRLAVSIADQLNLLMGPGYYADVDLRTVGETVEIGTTHITHPDVGVFEGSRAGEPGRAASTGTSMAVAAAPIHRAVHLEDESTLRSVHVCASGTHQLVTAIELLSPYNKRRGDGLEEYRAKRRRLLASPVNLIEVDFLRGGERPGPEVVVPPIESDYVLLVNRQRSHARRVSEIWPVSLDETLPFLPVPLLSPDPDVVIDLGAGVRSIYDSARYAARIDYRQPVPPPELRPGVAAWVDKALGRWKL